MTWATTFVEPAKIEPRRSQRNRAVTSIGGPALVARASPLAARRIAFIPRRPSFHLAALLALLPLLHLALPFQLPLLSLQLVLLLALLLPQLALALL